MQYTVFHRTRKTDQFYILITYLPQFSARELVTRPFIVNHGNLGISSKSAT